MLRFSHRAESAAFLSSTMRRGASNEAESADVIATIDGGSIKCPKRF